MSSPTCPPVNGMEVASSAADADTRAQPRDGSWSLPDPNQVGSGWNEDLDGSPVFEDDMEVLAAAYDRLVERARAENARAAAGQSETDNGDNGDDGDDALSVDDDWEVQMLLAPAYLEFILKLRDCTRDGCCRRTPCTECAQHDGASVPSGLWHFLSDRRIEAHLAQYLRVRSMLPPWQSTHPPYLVAPRLVSGGKGWSASDEALSSSWDAMGARLVRERELLAGWPEDAAGGAVPASVPPSSSPTEEASPPPTSSAADLERRRIFHELQGEIRVFEHYLARMAEQIGNPGPYLWDRGRIGLVSRIGGARAPRVQPDAGEDGDDSDLPPLEDVSESSWGSSEQGENDPVA